MAAKKRRTYSKVFKTDAVKLVLEEGRTASEVARNLAIGSGTLQRWGREAKVLKEDAFSGNGRMAPDQDKIRKLETEVKCLKMEREILKKTTAFFAREQN